MIGSRYARQIALPEVGSRGQQCLGASRVLVLGAGALGCAVTTSLVASGVGHVAVVDFDVVEQSNLARQTLYRASDIGRPKAAVAAEALGGLNPEVEVVAILERIDAATVDDVLAGCYDVVVDGTDDYATRRLAHDAALASGIPYVWGSALGWDGQVTVFRAGDVALDDLYPQGSAPDPGASCAVSGVFGPVCQAVGALMAGEAMKLLLGAGEPLLGRLAIFDGLDATWREIRFATVEGPAAPAAPENGTMTEPAASRPISPEELAVRLAAREAGGDDFLLIDVREPWEAELASIPGSQLVPMQTLWTSAESGMTPPEEPVVLYCHIGGRSSMLAQRLVELGWPDVSDLTGGIAAWADRVDPVMPRY